MHKMVLLLSIMALSIVGARAVLAETLDHPPLMTKRDVTVVYEVKPDPLPKPMTVTVSFKAEGNKVRVDYPHNLGSTILDRSLQEVTIVMNTQRFYTSFSPRHGLRSPFLIDLNMKYRRRGMNQVANLACQEWDIISSHGTAKACITEDGVILAEHGVDADGVKGDLKAKHVTYGPLDDALFLPPTNYEKVTPQLNRRHQPGKVQPHHPS